MIQRRKIITILTGALCLCAAVRADMMPLCPADVGCRPSCEVHIPNDPAPTSSCCALVGFIGLADFGSFPVGLPIEPQAEAGQTSTTEPTQILSDSQNSLSLCLYGLLGLGLCWSAPSVNRVHFGCIANRWYRGPFQIDRSSAISPDYLCSAPVVCFIQPDFTAEDCLEQCYRGAIASLLRESQFTPTALASRGPPPCSC